MMRRQSLPFGASQPWVPGWILVSASTPTGRLRMQPAGGFRGVDVARAVQEVRVERVDVLVVVPERPQRLHELAGAGGVGFGGGRPAGVVVRVVADVGLAVAVTLPGVLRVLRRREVVLVLVRVDQPARPGRGVDDHADADDAQEGRYAVGQHRPGERRADAVGASGPGAPEEGEQPERRERVGRLPLAPTRQPPAHAGGDQPRPEDERPDRAGALRDVPAGVGREAVQAGAVPVAVRDVAVHGQQHEERDEDVEQRDPREHELHAVEATAAGRRPGRAASSR